MNIYFIGCLHFGHASMARHRGFQDEFYHDEHLIEEWNKVVRSPKDIIYILGDITMETSKHYYQLDRLRGVKHVVLGNHDRRQDVRELLNFVDTVAGNIDYKGYVLTHAPIHPNEIGFCRGNIHAHIHHVNKLEECIVKERYNDEGSFNARTLHKYYNVDAKILNYKPISLEELTNAKV